MASFETADLVDICHRVTAGVVCLQQAVERQANWIFDIQANMLRSTANRSLARALADVLVGHCEAVDKVVREYGIKTEVYVDQIISQFYLGRKEKESQVEVMEYPVIGSNQDISVLGNCSIRSKAVVVSQIRLPNCESTLYSRRSSLTLLGLPIELPMQLKMISYREQLGHDIEMEKPGEYQHDFNQKQKSKICHSLSGGRPKIYIDNTEKYHFGIENSINDLSSDDFQNILPRFDNMSNQYFKMKKIRNSKKENYSQKVEKTSCLDIQIPNLGTTNSLVKMKGQLFYNGMIAQLSGLASTESGQSSSQANDHLQLNVGVLRESELYFYQSVVNFVRYKSHASIYFLDDGTISLSFDRNPSFLFKIKGSWKTSYQVCEGKSIPSSSRGYCLVEDSVYFIDEMSQVRSIDLNALFMMDTSKIKNYSPELRFDGQAIDLEYKQKKICILTAEGLLHIQSTQQAPTKRSFNHCVDVRKLFGIGLPADVHFTAMSSSKRETVVTCYSKKEQSCWLFVIYESNRTNQSFIFNNQSSHIHSLKLITKGKISCFSAVTSDGDLHLLRCEHDRATVLIESMPLLDCRARGSCVFNENTIIVYGSNKAVAVSLMDIY
jgi:hypothetical protein